MRLIKNEVGAFDFWLLIMLLAAFVVVFSLSYFSTKEQARVEFETSFSIDSRQIEDRNLVKPLVNKKLEEFKKIANDCSATVEAILSEPESLTPEDLKERLERLKTSRETEKSAWSTWRRACYAAKWEGYVMSCDATK